MGNSSRDSFDQAPVWSCAESRSRETQDGIRQIVESERPAAASVLAGPRGERQERLRPGRRLQSIGLHKWLTETEKAGASISSAESAFTSWVSMEPGAANA